MRLALDMYEFGESMVRQRFIRENPDADEATINAMVRAWRLDRPGAPHGDSAGRPSYDFDRFKRSE